MAGDGQYENADDERKAKKKTAGIIVFVFLLISLAIFLFIYGFEVTFYSGDTFEIEKIPLLMMSTVFTLLGFGFLLSTYKNGKLTGFTIAIFVLSLNYILSPLFQKLWFIAFLKDQDEGVNFAEYYWGEGNIDKVVISPTTFRLANMCTISYLLGLTGLVGRISLPGIIGSQVLFNLTWHLNLHLNILMSEAANPKPLVYFDDYGTYLVYLFGAVFGLIASLLNRSNQDDRDKQSDRSSTLYTLIGSIFLFCTFSMAYFDIIRLHGAM